MTSTLRAQQADLVSLARFVVHELVARTAEMQATVRVMDAGRAIARMKMMYVGSPVRVGRVDAWEVGAFACSSTTRDDLRAA